MAGLHCLAAALFASALFASAANLSAARQDLARGDPAEVLVDLEPAEVLTEAEGPEGARLLTAAAELAKKKGDAPLALQLAQRASRLDPTQARALELLAEWSLADHEFAAAQRYADRWVKLAPADPGQRRFVERLEQQSRDWHPALDERPAVRAERPQARQQTQTAEVSPAGPGAAASKPMAARRLADKRAAGPAPGATASAPQRRVVLYGDAEGKASVDARTWLKARNVAFVDRDLGADRLAGIELQRKERAAGGGFRGLPVLEIDGKLLAGFKPDAWKRALGLP